MANSGHHAVVRTGIDNYGVAPYDPSVAYAEYTGPVGTEPNPTYAGVRSLLASLYPPGTRYGTGVHWNPLGELVEPGQTVFIKPNLVDHHHRHGGDIWSVITHPSVVRAVADYVALALRGNGRIIIGDNPHVDCNWDAIEDLYRADELCERVSRTGVDTQFVDLRSWHMPDLSGYGWRDRREPRPGDPSGDRTVTLQDSYMDVKPWWLYRGTFNERGETIKAHRGGHTYSFARTMFDADVFVSIPKLKAHAKVGVTLNTKGLIGTVTNKNCLVHWSIGFPAFGGDEYPRPAKRRDYLKLYWQHAANDVLPSSVQLELRDRLGNSRVGRAYKRCLQTDAQANAMLRGAWDGNDTTWRMTADVYNAFVGLPGQPQRKTLSIIDGVIGGDTDGPHFPHRVRSGALVGAEHLLVADLVATRLMDFSTDSVWYLGALAGLHGIDRNDISVSLATNEAAETLTGTRFFDATEQYLGFRPPHRWPTLSLHDHQPAETSHDVTILPGRPADYEARKGTQVAEADKPTLSVRRQPALERTP